MFFITTYYWISTILSVAEHIIVAVQHKNSPPFGLWYSLAGSLVTLNVSVPPRHPPLAAEPWPDCLTVVSIGGLCRHLASLGSLCRRTWK
jgi:hypothetical protein